MNALNSLIIEGNVAEKPMFDNTGKLVSTLFPISVKRFSKSSNNEPIEESYKFDIETYGKMAEYCNDKCSVGRGIRVVGRLVEREGKVSVVAEHIEFKPVIVKPESDE